MLLLLWSPCINVVVMFFSEITCVYVETNNKMLYFFYISIQLHSHIKIICGFKLNLVLLYIISFSFVYVTYIQTIYERYNFLSYCIIYTLACVEIRGTSCVVLYVANTTYDEHIILIFLLL